MFGNCRKRCHAFSSSSGRCAITCRHGICQLSGSSHLQYIWFRLPEYAFGTYTTRYGERGEPGGSFVSDALPRPTANGNAVDRPRNRSLPPRMSPPSSGTPLPARSATRPRRPPSGGDTPQASMLRHCKRPENILVSIVYADRQYLRSDEGASPAMPRTQEDQNGLPRCDMR